MTKPRVEINLLLHRRQNSRHPSGPPAAHGYPPPRPGYPAARSQYYNRQHEQYPGYQPGQAAPQGYYDAYGNWIQYGQGYVGYDSAPYVSATDLAAQQQQQSAEPTGKGKGFAAKMGDRAVVKSTFSLEQRQAKVGKGVVEGGDDEYGADILVGGGGLVRSHTQFGVSRSCA
jgi:hypothetical protein